MAVRGIRGATTVQKDVSEEILSAVRELLSDILQANPTLRPDDLASVVFSVTHDLQSVYPARAARQLGWVNVPLLDVNEMVVEDELPRCIRVLLSWNTDLPQSAVRPVYLREAVRLRPDLTAAGH
jgi:chorismate mutase